MSGQRLTLLKDWQRSLAALPVGTAVYVVYCLQTTDKEPTAVFLSAAAAQLWRARQVDGLTRYVLRDYTVHRQPDNELTLLTDGAPSFSGLAEEVRAAKERRTRQALAPLPNDSEIRAEFDRAHGGLYAP